MCVEYVRILHAWSPAWYGTESVNEYKRMQTNANEFKPSLGPPGDGHGSVALADLKLVQVLLVLLRVVNHVIVGLHALAGDDVARTV